MPISSPPTPHHRVFASVLLSSCRLGNSVREGEGAFGNAADVANDAAFADDLIPLPTANKLYLDYGSGPMMPEPL